MPASPLEPGLASLEMPVRACPSVVPPSMSSRPASTVTVPALPAAKVPLAISPRSRSSSCPALTATVPAAPREPRCASLVMPGDDPVPRPETDKRPASTSTSPALPSPKVSLLITPLPSKPRSAAETATRPAFPSAAAMLLMLPLGPMRIVRPATVTRPAFPPASVLAPISPATMPIVSAVTRTSPPLPANSGFTWLVMPVRMPAKKPELGSPYQHLSGFDRDRSAVALTVDTAGDLPAIPELKLSGFDRDCSRVAARPRVGAARDAGQQWRVEIIIAYYTQPPGLDPHHPTAAARVGRRSDLAISPYVKVGGADRHCARVARRTLPEPGWRSGNCPRRQRQAAARLPPSPCRHHLGQSCRSGSGCHHEPPRSQYG